MNFAFLNAYNSEIEPLLFGVAWTEQQRATAMDAIMKVSYETIKNKNDGLVNKIRYSKLISAGGKLLDAWITVAGKEYRMFDDFENICWNLIMRTEQKRRTRT